MAVGPLRVSAGVIRLRPVRMRDAAQWSRARLADRAHLEPWEPSAEADWTVRHTISSWPAVCSSLRSEARRGRMLPYVIELEGQFCGQLTIGNVTHGALRSAWIGYWVAREHTGRGIATAAAAALTEAALGLPGIERTEIVHDLSNAASGQVPRKLGYARVGTGAGRFPRAPGECGTSAIWRLVRPPAG